MNLLYVSLGIQRKLRQEQRRIQKPIGTHKYTERERTWRMRWGEERRHLALQSGSLRSAPCRSSSVAKPPSTTAAALPSLSTNSLIKSHRDCDDDDDVVSMLSPITLYIYLARSLARSSLIQFQFQLTLKLLIFFWEWKINK